MHALGVRRKFLKDINILTKEKTENSTLKLRISVQKDIIRRALKRQVTDWEKMFSAHTPDKWLIPRKYKERLHIKKGTKIQ